MSKERLIYLPLGGAGEIGMNAYVYGWGEPGAERLILVDLGVTFPDMDTTPGVNLIMPDITFLKDNADRLDAIFRVDKPAAFSRNASAILRMGNLLILGLPALLNGGGSYPAARSPSSVREPEIRGDRMFGIVTGSNRNQ